MSDQLVILNDERAAEMLGTTPRRLRAWIRQGVLPGKFLPDGSAVLTLADLLKWLEPTPHVVATGEAASA